MTICGRVCDGHNRISSDCCALQLPNLLYTFTVPYTLIHLWESLLVARDCFPPDVVCASLRTATLRRKVITTLTKRLPEVR
ncbi:hypothetical protein L596_030876 [Steinernema carpocapsae]|uniref:Uncharacterized protein n=1 Tax=Steinernema carpocapsae TaxID=34508 RepID=A0A4U5LNF0_STECR|nr:hypothetical protein L596_030876 [Steinernema carpocapsae]